jgi:hypothetical protein
MSDEGLQARFEHIRMVVLTVEAHAPVAPILMFSDPIPMNAHEWRKAREEGFGVHVLPNGGVTRCRLYRVADEGDVDELIAFGEVRCSDNDNYVKALGRVKSLGQARRALA